MNITEKENLIVKILDDLKCTEIKVLDVEKMTSIMDRMIICTGRSSRHVSASAGNLSTELKAHGFIPAGIEGLKSSDWVLVDLGDIIIHIMQRETRDFYNLEALWGDVPVINDQAKMS